MPHLQLTEIKEVSYPLLHYLNTTDGEKTDSERKTVSLPDSNFAHI